MATFYDIWECILLNPSMAIGLEKINNSGQLFITSIGGGPKTISKTNIQYMICLNVDIYLSPLVNKGKKKSTLLIRVNWWVSVGLQYL